MLDNIRKISKSQPINLRHIVGGSDDCSILDFAKSTNEGSSTVMEGFAVRFICRLENGEEYSVLFDTSAYICNDSGKTIEKVVVNLQ